MISLNVKRRAELWVINGKIFLKKWFLVAHFLSFVASFVPRKLPVGVEAVENYFVLLIDCIKSKYTGDALLVMVDQMKKTYFPPQVDLVAFPVHFSRLLGFLEDLLVDGGFLESPPEAACKKMK